MIAKRAATEPPPEPKQHENTLKKPLSEYFFHKNAPFSFLLTSLCSCVDFYFELLKIIIDLSKSQIYFMYYTT
ncbi:hypothetical protein AGR7C_Cc230005 [Agrobacterium deltaense Zutra 3/1]|uniref:Uncharacterized protein n=1 Tax=Agrobacterium deltaense Zutra 3/1 TaxID=1183427 RepID=A0A1S7PZZ0_9HYPH|nr:hypothetical protein AGR7C_Cc230005 [Agrobacterium deltaense Zutra 3/1]